MNKDPENYYYRKMPDENFSVEIIKRDLKGQGPVFDSHWHEHMQFYYFVEGSAFQICNAHKFVVNPKDFVVINSNELHYTESLSENLSCYVMKVDFPFLYSNQIDSCQVKFIAPMSNNYITFKNLIRDDEQICNCIENIIKEYYSKNIGFELAVKSDLYMLIVLLLRNYVDGYLTKKEFDIRVKNITRMDQVFEYIDHNLSQKITIHELASVANISDYHFCKLYKKITGKTPMDYINSLRINRAVILLSEGNSNITEIAFACGFCDSNYFSRIFKKYKGVAPNKYNRKE
jgi:AraC-like DNA-binding protein/mannose-6-phosphate isomerase-like protein (cupin superfamily)